jgi:probable HAF family extracellular repeat protein
MNISFSWIGHITSGFLRSSRCAGRWKRRAANRPKVESLEGRVVPSAAYKIIDLGTLGGTFAEPFALNNSGEVVGYSYTKGDLARYAFRDSHSKMSSLGSLLGGPSIATGINNRGQIVGFSTNKRDSASVAFLYSCGRMKAIGKVPPELPTHLLPSFSINDRDQVIGFSSNAGDAQILSGGRLTDLGSLNGLGSVALGLNNHGAVVGYSNVTPYRDYFNPGIPHAFLYQNGHMTDLGTLGANFAEATAVNNSGDVVGWSSTTGSLENDVFLYHHGTMINLGNLGGPAASPTGVNDKDQVVGWSNVNGSATEEQFLYSNGKMVDLNTLIPTNTGLTLGQVVGINNRGQIAAYGTTQRGKEVVLLLNPLRTN